MPEVSVTSLDPRVQKQIENAQTALQRGNLLFQGVGGQDGFAGLDDALDVSVELQQVGASQINLKQSVSRAGLPGKPLCEASVRLPCVSIATMKPVRIPQTIVQKIRPA